MILSIRLGYFGCNHSCVCGCLPCLWGVGWPKTVQLGLLISVPHGISPFSRLTQACCHGYGGKILKEGEKACKTRVKSLLLSHCVGQNQSQGQAASVYEEIDSTS